MDINQYDFLLFVKAMWPDFIYRQTNDPDKWGHHQIISNEFLNILRLEIYQIIEYYYYYDYDYYDYDY